MHKPPTSENSKSHHRYGLAVGSYSAWLVRALMVLCWPIAWPISKLLDYLLGSEHSVGPALLALIHVSVGKHGDER